MKEMKAPKHFVPEMLRKLVVYSLERPDEEQEQTSVLIHGLCTDGLVTGENLIQVGFTTSRKSSAAFLSTTSSLTSRFGSLLARLF